jgi:hypothetical protein
MRKYLAASFLVLSATLTTPADACSNNKLDLDWCGAQERPKPEPLNKPDFGGPSTPKPDVSGTVVTPRDSSGRELHGPGVTKRF